MKHETFERLERLICQEIDKETDKNMLTPDTVKTIGMAVDIMKDISTIEGMEQYAEGYSGHYPERGWSVTPYYSYGERHDNSYARRGMGRYSRDSEIEHLERMMQDAKSDSERDSLRKAIIALENLNS